jgi:hypothetical protein
VLGLRTLGRLFTIPRPKELLMRKTTRIACSIFAVLLLGLSPAVVAAQTQVKGSGTTHHSNGSTGVIYFEHIEVNAWLDAGGNAHGRLTWEGDNYWVLPDGTGFHGGPSDAFQIDVDTFIVDPFGIGDDTTVLVGGVVVNSPNHAVDEGGHYGIYFTDNSALGLPDEINFAPIHAGRIRVR